MLKPAARGGRQIQIIPTMGSAQKQRKYQRLGAAPASDISVNAPPPMMNSSAPIMRKMAGFHASMSAVIISIVVIRRYHNQSETGRFGPDSLWNLDLHLSKVFFEAFFSKRLIQTKITAPTNAIMMEPMSPPPGPIPKSPR